MSVDNKPAQHNKPKDNVALLLSEAREAIRTLDAETDRLEKIVRKMRNASRQLSRVEMTLRAQSEKIHRGGRFVEIIGEVR